MSKHLKEDIGSSLDESSTTMPPLSDSTQPDGGHRPLSTVLLVAAAIGVAVLVRVFVAEPYIVPTGSMLDTIQLGDRLIGEKISFRLRQPEAGDIITFADPDDPSTTLIKRVIATEGQTVDLRDGVVYVDDEALDEPYTNGKPSEPLTIHSSNLTADISYPYTVPEGYVWVMGDNRTNSADSRYFGAIPVSSITSRALFIYWPLADFAAL